MKYKQTIVVPAYKPSDNILAFVEELQEHFENILIVDDGGQAEFSHIFEQLEAMGACVLTHGVNQGKGRALKTAFNYCVVEAAAKIGADDAKALLDSDSKVGDADKSSSKLPGVITVDADGQHRVSDIIKVAEAMEHRPEDVVLGCRDFTTGNVPARSLIGNNISRVVYKWLAGVAVSDTQTGLRGLPYSFLPALITCAGERYEYETNMFLLMKELGYHVTEVSIETIYEDNNSSSHFNPVRDSIRIYSVILKYSVSSLLSALVDYIVFAIALSCGAKITIATYIARAISCIFNFSLNKKMVFKGKGNAYVQFIKYLVLVVISGTISGLAVTALAKLAPQINPVIIKIPVEIILYFFNYVVQRAFIFKDEK